MPDSWFRFWYVTPWTDEINGAVTGLYTMEPQQTHLRSFVTWYVESTGLQAEAEPCAAGIWAQQQPQTDPEPTPPDIADVPNLEGDWWQWEVSPPTQLHSTPRHMQRLLWPRDAPRTWEIHTNRRASINNALYVYLIWSFAEDVFIHSRAVVAWSMLIRTPG